MESKDAGLRATKELLEQYSNLKIIILTVYEEDELITAGVLKKLVASHIGLNSETGAKMNTGELEVELVPQGSLAEKIRSGEWGLEVF